MFHQIINNVYIKTLNWRSNHLIDWNNAGQIYDVDGSKKNRLGRYSYGDDFDACITSRDDIYTFLYKKLGTKGIILKHGELIREINRSSYRAESYEYPAAFWTRENGRTYLIHCPHQYNQLDFQDVETGEFVATSTYRNPDDIYHSRLQISPDGRYLLSRGWVWHPKDIVCVFALETCFDNPLLFDNGYIVPEVNAPINMASFIDNHHILIGSYQQEKVSQQEIIGLLNDRQIGVWDLTTNEVKNITSVHEQISNLFAINYNYAWDFYHHPKIINLKTGEVEHRMVDIFSGIQASSIIKNTDHLPQIAFNPQNNAVAITLENYKLAILTWKTSKYTELFL